MNIGLWAEIRRLAEIEKLSGRAIVIDDYGARDISSPRPPASIGPRSAGPARRTSLPGPAPAQDRCSACQVSRPLGRASPRRKSPAASMGTPAA